MAGGLVDKRDVAAGAGLSVVLAWLFTVSFCPMQVAAAFPAGGAVLFIGAFMLGCTFGCAALLIVGQRGASDVGAIAAHASRTPLAALLPLGITVQMVALALGFPCAEVWVAACSLIAGLGEAALLLAWGRRLASRTSAEMLGTLAVTCTGAAALAVVFGALSFSAASMRIALAVLSVVSVVVILAPAQREKPAPGADARVEDNLPGTFVRLWEPVLGLGLSLMSAVLPWGSFMEGGSVSIPVYWSFAIGALLVAAAALCAVRMVPGKADFDSALHIAIPLMAAAVVALRLVGDLDGAAAGLTVAKGIGSGIASAGFLVCAWLAMGREARGRPDAGTPFALGFGAACLVGFAILPVHVASQSAAALAAPFLSLAFLAVTCCSSIVHLRRRVEPQRPVQSTAPGIEDAADALALHYGLSPRETQVLHQLVLGRSAESIGAILGISPNTVRSHVGNIHGKLGIQSRDQLADLIDEIRTKLT